jgi:hypothetical protein
MHESFAACKMSPMAAGPDFLGFVYFAAAKFAGYTLYCRWGIGPQVEYEATRADIDPPPLPNVWKSGGLRTLIGLAMGAVVGLGFWSIPYFAKHDAIAEPIFFGGLVPVRIFEWWLLLALLYKAFPIRTSKRATLIAVGILVSFALDAIGILAAFILPGGVWVC